jgi:Potassium-transporting ATPase A subunit
MTLIGCMQILAFCAIVIALVKPLGSYMALVFNGERTFLAPVLRPVEVALYRVAQVDENREQHWLTYTVAMPLFHVGDDLKNEAEIRSAHHEITKQDVPRLPRKLAWTIFWRRQRPRKSSSSFAMSRPRANSLPCAAMVPMTHRRLRRPTSASP